MKIDALSWHKKSFDEMDKHLLYRILNLRSAVFVVEQNCAYQELDNLDQISQHFWAESEGEIIAYCRYFYKDKLVLGRILTCLEFRKFGLGKVLMNKVLDLLSDEFPNENLYIGAQSRLLKFYESFGFQVSGDEYLEDGIWHTPMELQLENYFTA